MSDATPHPGVVLGDKTGYGRITTDNYCLFPEQHRNTFVCGMADMLECLPVQPNAVFQRGLEFMRSQETSNLRGVFDGYIAEDADRRRYLVASNFIAMLNGKGREPKPFPKPFGKLRSFLGL